MSLTEIFQARKGSLFKIKRLSQNPTFFRYGKLAEELADLLYTSDARRKSKAGSFRYLAKEPARTTDIGDAYNNE